MNNGEFNFAAPIISALITGGISLAIAFFFLTKRRAVTFLISGTEDLTRSLQGHNQHIVVSVGQQPFLNLNRATVRAKNTGNVSLEGLKFDIQIPGQHSAYIANAIAEQGELDDAVSITTDQPPPTYNPTFHVSVSSFLNPKESFWIILFFDNDPVGCKVRCRVADLKTKIRYGQPPTWRDFWRADIRFKIIFSFVVIVGGVQVLGIVVILFLLVIHFVKKAMGIVP